MDKLYVALMALAGGLVAALLGWMESGERFDGRKFGGSAIRALIAGALFAVGYELAAGRVGVTDLLYAFLGGAGVDAIGNRAGGALGNASFPLASRGAKPVAPPAGETHAGTAGGATDAGTNGKKP